MPPMVKKKTARQRKRVSTEELGELLGCSKNSVVRQAKRYQWKKEQMRNSRGQLVTTYSMTDVRKAYPDLERAKRLNKEKAVTEASSTRYETPELVEAVQVMVREYVAIQRLTVEAQEKAVQRIVKVFAANVGLLLLLAITAGTAFWQWHNSEIYNLQQLQPRRAGTINTALEDFSRVDKFFQPVKNDQAASEKKKPLSLTKMAMGGMEDNVDTETWPEK